jgi:hypothetical protein
VKEKITMQTARLFHAPIHFQHQPLNLDTVGHGHFGGRQPVPANQHNGCRDYGQKKEQADPQAKATLNAQTIFP